MKNLRNKHIYVEKLIIGIIAFLIISSLSLSSQDDRRARRARQKKAEAEHVQDSIPSISDSAIAAQDSIALSDSLHTADSLSLLSKSSLERPAFSTARDSIIEDFSDGKKMIYYYGDVTVTYGDMKLSADYMEYDLQTQTVFARGTKDTTGNVTGLPKMEENGKSYSMEQVKYNFDTRKALITNMVTQEQEGILHGKNIKMMPDQSINITKGKYTVCDCEHPHYYLHLTAAKVMTKPSQRTVFGPAYPVIEDVPLPVALPFGFIPKRPDRATGLLMPTFGEESSRGFYLRGLGMYFVIGDYFDLSLTGDFYTLGSWAIDLNSRYKVNYKFNGNISMVYSNNQVGEKGSTDFFQSKDLKIHWSHSQDPKARPGTSFSANVDFSTPAGNRFNSTSVNEALQNITTSTISYGKNWNSGKFNLSLNLRHNQNNKDSTYSFTLPDLTFSVARFYPFKRKNRVGKEKLYEQFSLSYNTSFRNTLDFKSSEFGKPGFGQKFKNGMAHNFQIGLPNFTLFKYININPTISYGMNWFFDKTEKVYNEKTGTIEDKKGGFFSTFGATHTYSGGISMNTRLYGMFSFGKHRKIQAIRHVISPSLSFNFSPEKGTHFNGWRTLNYTDQNGVAKSLDYNIYAGQINSPPGKGKTASMSISIGNNLEAKVRNLRDTTGTGMKKIKLIDNLNISTGYNFLADSLRLNNIGITMNTSVFGKLGINANVNFDPYAVNERGQKIAKFNVQTEGWSKPLRLTGASASLSYSFSGEGKINGNDGREDSSSPADNYTRIYYHPVTGEYIPGGWLYYMNPNSPWSVNISYNYSYSRSYQYSNGQRITKHNHNQTLSLNGNIRITPSFNINISTGFDFMAMKMTTTSLSAQYSLHCFNIDVSWVPMGMFQQWSFRIAANASALADLLRFKKSSSYWDNNF